MQHNTATADSSSPRATQIAALADEYRRRCAAGDDDGDYALIAANPGLMPELGEELRKLRPVAVVDDSDSLSLREKAGSLGTRRGEVRDLATRSHRDSNTSSGRLEVRCPSCHAPMEVAVDTALTDLTCSSCGSHFSLVDQSKATRMAPPLSKMGRFELIERLGVGGFGSVWKARDKELDRTVAIKIPRAGAITAEDQEKFFREARAAAQLRHPNIVSVHEVGRDGDSVYIVSDFVRGVTLGDWLTGQTLTSREAAELCAKIADALQHAHENGVVHRDLKPANIIIDGDGQPHLTDFGLARREVGEVTLTMDGQVLGTPAYMSPEQAEGKAHTADCRSDVYSLGVILFQLLTGELPFRGNARMLMHQVINDEPPSPRKLNSNVAKDLETITLKCLEKQPARRYQTVIEVADELRRLLKHEPIKARPVGVVGRTLRWAKRKPALTAFAAAFIASLTAGAITSSYFAVTAAREAELSKSALQQSEYHREQAQQINHFFIDEVFGLADSRRHDNAGISLLNALDIAEGRIERAFPQEPSLQITLRESLGRVFIAADAPDKAIKQLQEAIRLRKDLSTELNPQTLITRRLLGEALRNAARYAEARELLEATLADQIRLLGAGHEDTLTTSIQFGVLFRETLDEKAIESAEATYRTALASLGSRHATTLEAQSDLSWTLRWQGRPEEALPHAENAALISREVLGEDDWRSMFITYNLAACLQKVGRLEEAAELLTKLLQLRQRTLGAVHGETIWTAWRLASVLTTVGRPSQAEQVLSELHSHLGEVDTQRGVRRSGALNAVATEFAQLGRYEKAADFQQAAFELQMHVYGESDVRTIDSSLVLAKMLFQAGKKEQGLEVATHAFEEIPKRDRQEVLVNSVTSLFDALKQLDDSSPESGYASALSVLQGKYKENPDLSKPTRGDAK